MKRIWHLFIFGAMLASIGTLIIIVQNKVINMPSRVLVIVFAVEIAWILVAILSDLLTMAFRKLKSWFNRGKTLSKT